MSKLRWIRPVVVSDGDLVVGDRRMMGDTPVIVADWATSLSDGERDNFEIGPDGMLWFAEEVT